MSIRQGDLKAADVMLPLERFPVVRPTTLFKAALEEMARARLGIVCIVDDEGRLLGIITDGDIRRQLLRIQKPFSAFFSDDVIDHAVRGPTTILSGDSLKDAIDMMEQKQVWDLPVVDQNGVLLGLVHLHPVVRALMDGA